MLIRGNLKPLEKQVRNPRANATVYLRKGTIPSMVDVRLRQNKKNVGTH